VKLTLYAPAVTAAVAGTLTAALLLARFTVSPPLGAGALNVTRHGSVPAPVMIPFLQLNTLTAGVLKLPEVPLRLTVIVAAFVALVAMVNFPVAAPAPVGENFTVKL